MLLLAALLVWEVVPLGARSRIVRVARTVTPSIAAGGSHSCALLANGTAKCWGFNGSGQLGNGTTTNSSTPVVVIWLEHAVAISAGGRIRVRCWRTGPPNVGASTVPVSWGTAPRPARRRRSS